jgi:type I restriction enzyme S subunit
VIAPHLTLSTLPCAEVCLTEAEVLRLTQDDVLLIRTNGNPDYIAKSTIVTKDVAANHVIFASYLIRVRTKPARLSGAYLNYFLASPLGRRQAAVCANTSAGNHNLGARYLKQFVVPRPEPEEQRRIVEVLDGTELLLRDIENRLRAILALKKSLLQNLLTGKARVNAGATA